MNYIMLLGIIIICFLFICLFLLSIYLLILIFFSNAFSITPSITSSSKSIGYISKYIEKYILESNKKNIKILDLGSGYGTLMSKINKKLSLNKLINITGKPENNNKINVNLTGYEISKAIYKISKIFNKYNNINIINENILNLKDFDFDIAITFMLAKQQKELLNTYRNFPSKTLIIANSLPIPFTENDDFKLIEKIKVCFHWNIYIYKS